MPKSIALTVTRENHLEVLYHRIYVQSPIWNKDSNTQGIILSADLMMNAFNPSDEESVTCGISFFFSMYQTKRNQMMGSFLSHDNFCRLPCKDEIDWPRIFYILAMFKRKTSILCFLYGCS